MRILFISAFYPPHVVGGWEQLVQDINTRLRARGHTTGVLTSTYGTSIPRGQELAYSPILGGPNLGGPNLGGPDSGGPDSGGPKTDGTEMGVARLLRLEADLVNYRPLDFFQKREDDLRHNLEMVRRQIEAFNPDVVFIHVMWNLTRGIAWQAEQMLPGRVVYYVANNWPYAPNAHRAFWEDPARRPLQKLFKGLLAPLALRSVAQEELSFPLRFERVLTVSQAMLRDLAENAGIPAENMRVVYNGVEVDQFSPLPTSHTRGDELSLLYAGALAVHKGVHTAVEALAALKRQGRLDGVCLTIVGSGHPEYEAGLRRIVKENQLEENVRFWPRVAREEMADLLRKFDVLIFPSMWDEPLARMMQEAMASGLVVIGTLTGGTPELLVAGETGLAFTPGDADELALRIEDLRRSPELRVGLAERGRAAVLEKFDLNRMIDEIEINLSHATASPVSELSS